MKVTKFAIARGRVQGVGFRYTARSIAHELGLVGYAKNLSDGTVEMVIHGHETTVERFFERLQKEFGAQIQIEEHTLTQPIEKFEVR